MKPNKLTLLPLAAAMLAISPAALAQNNELDMTMTVMEEGQEPAGFIQKIRLPSPAEIATRNEAAAETGVNTLADEVEAESGKLLDEAAGTVTDGINDILSIDGADGLPGDIVDNLSEDLPLLDDDDLPVDLPQDSVQEPAGVIDNMDNAPLDGAGDAGAEAAKTVEEAKKLLP